jgi:hypothetical protein
MQIDRRDFLAAIAASSAAAILPAFPPAASGVRRVKLVNGPVFSVVARPTPPIWDAFHNGLWHYDPNSGGIPLIRHAGTGLTCRPVTGYPSYLAVQAIAIDNPLEAWPDDEAIEFIGQTSQVAMFNVPVFCALRPGHKGAVFLHWPQATASDPDPSPIIEDAPPLAL